MVTEFEQEAPAFSDCCAVTNSGSA